MIVLGDKYKFSKYEKKRLGLRPKDILYVSDTLPAQKIIDIISSHVDQLKTNVIIVNIDAEVDPSVIHYLTNLQFETDVTYYTMEHFLEYSLRKCYIPSKNDALDFLDELKPYTKWQYFQKRCVDYFGVFWLILVLAPLVLWGYIQTTLQSPGSIFFVQPRIGYRNKVFGCIKLRSMHEKSEFFDHYTQVDDPRIFPWGKTMRKYRFDEIPQVINILRGDMHLIGPRAEWNELSEKYQKQLPFYNERHLVRPGISGWAQVNYPYGANLEDTRQKLMYDLYYIKHWSLWLEFQIAWKTVVTVIKKKGM